MSNFLEIIPDSANGSELNRSYPLDGGDDPLGSSFIRGISIFENVRAGADSTLRGAGGASADSFQGSRNTLLVASNYQEIEDFPSGVNPDLDDDTIYWTQDLSEVT